MSRDYLEQDRDLINGIMERLPDAIEQGRWQDVVNLRTAGRYAWERKELGSEEAWLFACRYNTPIVPPGHPGHPHELIKRGWKPNDTKDCPITISRWPDGTHFYAQVNGKDVQDAKGNVKWNSYGAAFKAAMSKL